MHVAIVSEVLAAGVGRHVSDLSIGLRRRGHAVTLFGGDARVEAWRVEAMQAAGVACVPIHAERAVGLSDISAVVQLSRLIARHGPFDVTHGHSAKGGALARLALGRKGRVVYTPHAFATMDPAMSPAKRRFYTLAEQLMMTRTDRLVAVSQAELEVARRMFGPSPKLRLAPNGLGPVEFMPRDEARARLGLGASEVCVGFVGRFSGQKRPLRFARVFQRLAAQFPQARAALVGSGGLRPELDRYCDSAGLGARLAVVEDDHGWALMKGFDILALTSAYEGLPYVLLEALQAGLPIVCDTVGGAAETVADGVNGYVLPPGADEPAVAQALSRLAGDADLRARMGAASHERAAAFDLDSMLDRITAVYTD